MLAKSPDSEDALPPPEWRPKRKGDRGKLFLEEYKNKIGVNVEKKRQRLKDQRKLFKEQKKKDVLNKGRYKCSIRQCSQRFFSKTEQIAHTALHRDAIDYGFQRRALIDTLWSTRIVQDTQRDTDESMLPLIRTAIQLIVEYANPTIVWSQTLRPTQPIKVNPTCSCVCCCGFEKYQTRKREELAEVAKLKPWHALKKRKRRRAIQRKYGTPGALMTEVSIGKVTDMVDFNCKGPNLHNIQIKES